MRCTLNRKHFTSTHGVECGRLNAHACLCSPRSLRSFWSAPRIATSRRTPISFPEPALEYDFSGLTGSLRIEDFQRWNRPEVAILAAAKGSQPLGTRMPPHQVVLDTCREACWGEEGRVETRFLSLLAWAPQPHENLVTSKLYHANQANM